jgi:hypothetical protein
MREEDLNVNELLNLIAHDLYGGIKNLIKII